jgi:Glycosyl transferase 4-like domain
MISKPSWSREGGCLTRVSPQPGDRISTILVSYHFSPSREVGARRMSALAKYLTAKGTTVAVISAFAGLGSAGTQNSDEACLAACELERVPDRNNFIDTLLVSGKKWLRRCVSVWSRAKGHEPSASLSKGHREQSRSILHRVIFGALRVIDDKKGWSLRARRSLRKLIARYPASVVVVSGPPVSPLLSTVFVARKLRVPVVVDLRDPIADVGVAQDGRVPSRRWAVRRLVERYVIEHADVVVTTTPGLRDRLRSKYPSKSARITCVYNGFDGEISPARVDTGNQLTIVFAGELYLNRNPFPFLEAIDRLLGRPGIDESRIRVVFAGQCEFYGGKSVREWSSLRPCGRILTIHPLLDGRALKGLYEDATLLLNFAEGQPVQIPAKTFELLSLGREVLVACEPYSDTSRMIADLDGVFMVQLSETERLDRLLGSIYHRHVIDGRMSPPTKDSILRYSRAIQNERYGDLIDRLARRHPIIDLDGACHAE